MRSNSLDYEFLEARDLPQALTVLASDPSCHPFAGGTDIMVLFNAGVLPFKRLISIRKLTELTQISVSKTGVRIGAAVTYSAIQKHETLLSEFPLLCKAAHWTGSIANQNRGTLGGNIANGSPAADSPPALLVYDAELEIASALGTRRVAYSEFHTAYKKMQLAVGEMICAIHLLSKGDSKRHQYARKVGSRKAQAISKVCFHGVANLDGRILRDVRIALGSVAPFPLRCHGVESFLEDQPITHSLIGEAQKLLSEAITPIDDIRSTAEYRNRVSQNLLSDFLGQLL